MMPGCLSAILLSIVKYMVAHGSFRLHAPKISRAKYLANAGEGALAPHFRAQAS